MFKIKRNIISYTRCRVGVVNLLVCSMLSKRISYEIECIIKNELKKNNDKKRPKDIFYPNEMIKYKIRS